MGFALAKKKDDLASVHHPDVVGRGPQAEGDAWRKLWADVRDLRDRPAAGQVARREAVALFLLFRALV